MLNSETDSYRSLDGMITVAWFGLVCNIAKAKVGLSLSHHHIKNKIKICDACRPTSAGLLFQPFSKKAFFSPKLNNRLS